MMAVTPTVRPRKRVILDTDAKCEADDQYAIVHALLSPTLDVRGLVAAHFGAGRTLPSMVESREEIDLLLDLLGMTGQVRVENGAPHAISSEFTPVDSPGARLIIEEATTGEGPLYVGCLGPLTDMASALLLAPEVAECDVTVIWIGGPPYGAVLPSYPPPEFNLANDVHAANVVFASRIPLIQVPMPVFSMCSVGYAELAEKVEPCGELGAYLVRQLVEWNSIWHPGPIEHRSLGDSPAVGIMLNPAGGVYRNRPAPRFDDHGEAVDAGGRPITVCEAFDTRYLLEDFFAKLRRFSRGDPLHPDLAALRAATKHPKTHTSSYLMNGGNTQ